MKVSYGRCEIPPWGTVYTQRILVNKEELDKILKSVILEIKNGYPNRNLYSGISMSSVSYVELRMIPLEVKEYKEGNKIVKRVFLKLYHIDFLKYIFPELKSRLKVQNTYIECQE